MDKKIQTDGIIFDVDGTLWDSTESVAAAWNEILEHRPDVSFRATPDNLKKLFGRPLPVIASMIFTELSKPEYLELIQKCTDNEHEFLHKIPGKLFSGVRETLLALKEQYPLYIVSNCEAGYIETFLEATGLGDCFLDHECPGSSGKYKAENIRLIVERNTISHPVYIGDTDGDAQACQEAGVPFIFAGFGFGETTHYAAKIDTFSQIPEVLVHG